MARNCPLQSLDSILQKCNWNILLKIYTRIFFNFSMCVISLHSLKSPQSTRFIPHIFYANVLYVVVECISKQKQSEGGKRQTQKREKLLYEEKFHRKVEKSFSHMEYVCRLTCCRCDTREKSFRQSKHVRLWLILENLLSSESCCMQVSSERRTIFQLIRS